MVNIEQRRQAGLASVAKRNKARGEPKIRLWKVRRFRVRLEKRPDGWYAIAGKGEGVPATDYLVNLWLELEETRSELAALREKYGES